MGRLGIEARPRHVKAFFKAYDTGNVPRRHTTFGTHLNYGVEIVTCIIAMCNTCHIVFLAVIRRCVVDD